MEGIFKTYPIKDATQKDAVTYVSILFSLAQVDELDQKEDEAIRLCGSQGQITKPQKEEENLVGRAKD